MPTIRYKPKALSDEQIARLEAVADLPDDKIDFSDIPDDDEGYTGQYVRGPLFRPTKQQITLRLDANVLDWFKRQTPKGYQTDINRVLAEYVAAQQKKAG